MKKATEKIEKDVNNIKIPTYDLDKIYDEALEDEVFLNYVKKLDIPRNILKKYTMQLMQCAEEEERCKNSKSIYECKNELQGYILHPRVSDEGLVFEYIKCPHRIAMEKELEHQKNVYYDHVSEDTKNASMSDLYTKDPARYDVIRYIKKFISEYKKDQHIKGLYLNGSFGSGKTYLITAAFNELAKEGYKSSIVFWPDFLTELKTSFNNDYEDKFEKYEYIKKVPLLLIDDIGAENVTDWSRDDIFCPLVQYRMENHLTTFFTSNYTIEELTKHFAKDGKELVKARRIIERIKQLTDDMSLLSKNLRK